MEGKVQKDVSKIELVKYMFQTFKQLMPWFNSPRNKHFQEVLK